ncbi:MAG: glycerophosphodiester phosphodiesterase family protein [Acidimicrobiia bacterium]|nr:glycerophosphodiester phosphodiesterase family protein [Acidimicrobiia bacterium]
MDSRRRVPLLRPALVGLTLLVAACGDAGEPEVGETVPGSTAPAHDLQGHRGARGLKPESTLPAFESALDELMTTLELDLHLTADGRLVVWHDPFLDPAKCRLGPGAPAGAADPDDPATPSDDLRISAMTFDELGAYRCDRNPDPSAFPVQDTEPTALAGARFEIIALEDLFDFVELYTASGAKNGEQRDNASQVRFNIETKRVPNRPELIGDDFDGVAVGRLEQALLDLVEERRLVDRVTVQSFDHRSLWAIQATGSPVQLSALTVRGDVPDFADLAARGAGVWSPSFRTLDAANVAAAHDAGLLVLPWTVNDVAEMQRLIGLGVDGLITDRPDLARGL